MPELQDVVAERVVLAGIYQHGADAHLDISSIVTPATFTEPANAALWRVFTHALERCPEGKLDPGVVMASANELGMNSLLERPEERAMMRAVMSLPVHLANVRQKAGKIARLAVTRTLGDTLDEIKGNLRKVTGDEPMSHILGLVEQPVIDFSLLLNTSQENEPRMIGDGLSAYLDYLEANPVEQVGLPTCFPRFDRAIGGGLRRKTVNVIGARPKAGKSVIANTVAYHVARELGVPTLLLDTEMTEEDQRHRLLARLSQVSIDEIETGRYSRDAEKRRRVREACAFVEKAAFHYLPIAGMPFEEAIATMRRWVTRTVGRQENGRAKDCLVVFDYLKLMSAERLSESLKEYQALGFMMTGLHNFVHRFDLPCLAFVQLNRDGIDRESTDVVSQSDRIIWLCSNFSIYKRKSEDELAAEREAGGKDAGTRKLVNLVARHGPGTEDGDYISYDFKGQFASVVETGCRSESRGRDFKVSDDGSQVRF